MEKTGVSLSSCTCGFRFMKIATGMVYRHHSPCHNELINNQAHRGSIKWGQEVSSWADKLSWFILASLQTSSKLCDRVSSFSAPLNISPRNKWQYFAVKGRCTSALRSSFAILFPGSLTRCPIQDIQWSRGSTKRPLASINRLSLISLINNTRNIFLGPFCCVNPYSCEQGFKSCLEVFFLDRYCSHRSCNIFYKTRYFLRWIRASLWSATSRICTSNSLASGLSNWMRT